MAKLKSKGVVRNFTFPSMMDFIQNSKIVSIVVPIRSICFGSVKASVVVLRNSRGNIRVNKQRMKMAIFSIYDVICFFDSSICRFY